ncbi:DUF6785 family protein, partial [Verrucomicrobiota bacterium]
GLVFFLFLLQGGNAYFPESIPAIPLAWDLQRCFTQEPLCYLPSWIYANQIYFMFVAIAFFIPSRMAFSVWFITLAYGIYVVVGKAYLPPFHFETISDHRSGAMLVLTAVILWLGRSRWAQVARAVFRRADTEAAGRDRKAGLVFLGGITGMLAWFMWTGVEPGWALVFVAIGFMVCLLITRLVAETGIPFMRIYDCNAHTIMGMLPVSWVGPASVFMTGVLSLFFQYGSRVNAMTLATHALALDEKVTPARQPRRAMSLLAVLLAGFVICGAAHLFYSYHHSVSLDGLKGPIGAVGFWNNTQKLMLSWQRGHLPQPAYSRPGHIAFGAGLTGALSWACMTMPKWPLHPIGLLLAGTAYGCWIWASIFVGWLAKVLLVRYGGSRLYRNAKPFFLGLILGEVTAAVFWCVVAAALAFAGQPYVHVIVQRAY